MDPERLILVSNIDSVPGDSPDFNPEEALKKLQKKYDLLDRRFDDMMTEAMERSNCLAMEAELAYLVMKQVFNASNDGIWTIDRNARVIQVNRKLLELLGKTPSEVIGRRCGDFFPDLCKNDSGCPLKSILKGASLSVRDLTITFESGKTIPFMVTSTPLCGLDGSIIGIVETFADIAERKLAEEVLQEAVQEMERLATQDGLTQLANRRRFDDYLAAEWGRQIREKNPISLIICDVDFFKKYNDTYGHLAGDDCLKSVAAAIRQSVHRTTDLTARYGGEEFVVVIPTVNVQGALHLAEVMRSKVEEMNIPHSQSVGSAYVTISCGVASMIPSQDTTPKMLIEMADHGLYRAKHEGRNRVVLNEGNKTL